MLDNAKYGNKSVLPELRVIDSGILRGFVTINPRWAGFKEPEYYQASRSVYQDTAPMELTTTDEIQVSVETGDFDLRGFEVSRAELFDVVSRPVITFQGKKIKFSTECIRKFGAKNYVELLINPVERKFAVRPADTQKRSGVYFSKTSNGIYYPKDVPAGAYGDTIYSLFGWNKDYKYRIIGYLYEKDGELAYIFDAADCEAYLKSYVLSKHDSTDGEAAVHPLTPSGKHIRAIPKEWTVSFGKDACESAKQNPGEENAFRQLRLNQWVKQAVRWMPMEKWDRCAFAANEDDLEGRICYGGLDLSSTTDITAFVLVFPPSEDDPKNAAVG